MTKKSREYRRSTRERQGRYKWTRKYEAWARDIKGSMYPVTVYIGKPVSDIWECKTKENKDGI